MLNVAFAGATSTTVSPAASRFGLTTAGAAAARAATGNRVATAASRRLEKVSTLHPEILSEPHPQRTTERWPRMPRSNADKAAPVAEPP